MSALEKTEVLARVASSSLPKRKALGVCPRNNVLNDMRL